MRLWWADLARPDSLRALEGFEPMPRFPPVWRDDGARALVIADHPDGRKTVLEIEPRQGRVRTLPVPDSLPVHVAYHPDPGRLLVIGDRDQGRLGLTLYDRTTTPWRALARIDDVMLAYADPAASRIVFVRPFKADIWQADLDLRSVRAIDRVGMQFRVRNLVPRPDGIRVMDFAPDCAWRWRRVAGGAGPIDAHCLGDVRLNSAGSAYDAGRNQVLQGLEKASALDLGLLPLSALPLPPQAKGRPAERASR